MQGLIELTIHALVPSLKPTKCEGHTPCEQINGGKAAMLILTEQIQHWLTHKNSNTVMPLTLQDICPHLAMWKTV